MLKEFRKAAGEAGHGQPGNTYNDDCAAMSEELGKEVEQPSGSAWTMPKSTSHGRLRVMSRRDPHLLSLQTQRAQIFHCSAASMSPPGHRDGSRLLKFSEFEVIS
jgi:hypothetical protein